MAAVVVVAGVRMISPESRPSQSTNANVEVGRFRTRSLNVLSGTLDGTSSEVQRRLRSGNRRRRRQSSASSSVPLVARDAIIEKPLRRCFQEMSSKSHLHETCTCYFNQRRVDVQRRVHSDERINEAKEKNP